MKIYKITEELSSSSEYERVTPVYGVSKTSGTNLAWLKALTKIKEDYCQDSNLFPILVLESDANKIRPLEDFSIPEDCDILYYGISGFDKDPEGIWKEIYYEVKGYPHLVRLERMGSTHAVSFHNIKAVQSALEYVSAGLCNNVALDVVWAYELMSRFNTYALRKPVFVQGTSEEDNFYYKTSNIVFV
jgi:hypothetical protein